MRSLLFVNCLLIIGFLAVIAGTVFMVGWNGYNDSASHSIFILHAINGFLLIIRAVLKG
jgi:hypothetical protein